MVLLQAVMNAEGITGFLGKALCNGGENCCTEDDDCSTHGITSGDQVHWCGDDEDEVDALLTCGGANRNTKGAPGADVTTTACAVSAAVTAKCAALDETRCGGDNSCTFDSQARTCGPSTSAATCAGAASDAAACAAAGDCTYSTPVVVSSGSTCKTKLQCVKVWLSSRIRLFAVVMFAFLFLESCVHLPLQALGAMRRTLLVARPLTRIPTQPWHVRALARRLMVAGTFTLGRKATGGDGTWYHDSGELTDDMSAMDALGGAR